MPMTQNPEAQPEGHPLATPAAGSPLQCKTWLSLLDGFCKLRCPKSGARQLRSELDMS